MEKNDPKKLRFSQIHNPGNMIGPDESRALDILETEQTDGTD